MTSYRKITVEEAESIALSAFMHLAQEDEKLTRFLDMTGLRPETVRAAAAAPGFFVAVLDHVASDEPLLLELAKALETKPERIMEARHTLSPSDFE
jgi:Protein of unknown function (DUF3572)